MTVPTIPPTCPETRWMPISLDTSSTVSPCGTKTSKGQHMLPFTGFLAGKRNPVCMLVIGRRASVAEYVRAIRRRGTPGSLRHGSRLRAGRRA